MGDEDEYEGFRAGYWGIPPTSSDYRYRMGYQAGSWMREDEESTPTGGHCFIATAAFGTPLAPPAPDPPKVQGQAHGGGTGRGFPQDILRDVPPDRPPGRQIPVAGEAREGTAVRRHFGSGAGD